MKFKELREKYRSKFKPSLVAKAVEIALSMGGAMTPAVKKIEKMKKGLSDDPAVANALRLANEEVTEDFDPDPDIKKISMATNLFAKDELAKLKDFIAKNKLDKKKIVKDLDKKKNQLQHIRDVILNPSKKSRLAPAIIKNYKK